MSSSSSSTPEIPKHTLLESPNSRTIQILNWRITSCTNPISNASSLDALQSSLGNMPLPEMTFGSNYLEMEYVPSGWTYRFTLEETLKGVKMGELGEGDGGVKVGYADKWLQSRTDPNSNFTMPQTVAKPYDWTYTTTYPGHTTPNDEWIAADPDQEATQSIPIAELTRPDPILFYAEIPLFEDELHDNGSSSLLVRIRVMPTCIFVLSRFTLRVDNVLFRTFDTRFYHSFSSSPPLIVREMSGWEAPYDRVVRMLPKREDMTPLTDPSWIAKVLSDLPTRTSQHEGANTGWRGLGTKRQVLKLA
ncbi:type 2A phosphatase activator TIP41 [Coprinopsis sp. MPI-PUGE-AT-0042]|nr:type 2A phosphatase activator TIP41 [Coprinopsis sp. MPI-PUGE-AT-0042]